MPVTWLLDLDGVVLVKDPKWHAAPRTKHLYADNDSFKVRWAPKLIDEINRFGREHKVVYATTWIPWMFVVRHATGLGNFECIEWPNERVESFSRRCDLKQSAAEKVLAKDPLIWTDDDAIPPFGPIVDKFEKAGALLIRPQERNGLTPEDIDRIWDYADKHR